MSARIYSFNLKAIFFLTAISNPFGGFAQPLLAQESPQEAADAVAELPDEPSRGKNTEPQIVDLKDLDLDLMKERLRKTQGEFAQVKPVGSWQVTYQGRTENWKWSDKGGWICPKDAAVKCGDWVPTAFRWWPSTQAARGWFEKWRPMSRSGYSLSNESHDKRASAVKAADIPGSNAVEDGAESESTEVKLFEGNRMATESVVWHSNQANADAKMGISLKSGWVASIDFKGVFERLAWVVKTQQTIPTLDRIMMEKEGIQVSFLRMAK